MKKAFAQTVRDIKREVNKKVLKVPSIKQKVLDATSNGPWGPHGSHLSDIAQATRNYHEYQMIMSIIWKRVNDTGRNWRHVYKEMAAAKGILTLVRDRSVTTTACSALNIATKSYGKFAISSCSSRSFSAMASEPPRVKRQEGEKEVTSVEDPFDAPTYNIPEKPVTFVEGASYSVFILAGLGVAAAAAYAVFKELILEPKEYKIFGKALERVQNDVQVKVRIGSPVKGYGQESQNRAARQRIPNRMWKDEEGVEHVQVHFHIRGSNGGGRVYAEMFKGPDKQWKFTYLIVDILSPSPAKLMLESYIPS